MRERVLGRSGLRVSEIGFGCGPSAGLMVGDDVAARRHAIGRALDRGITFFDTAPVYGDGASERNLGSTLRDLRATPTIATKVALELADLDDIAGAVERSVEASLVRLGVASVPLVHLHNRVGAARRERAAYGSGAVLTLDDVLGAHGVAAGFARLRSRGLIRAAGCSAYGGEMPLVETLIASGSFDTLMLQYSLFNRSAFEPQAGVDPRFDFAGIGRTAADAGLGIIALRVLEAGALADRAGEAIRFALANPAIASVLVGISDVGHVDAAADASEAQ